MVRLEPKTTSSSRTCKNRRSRQAGFTLLEILIVLSLIVMVLGVGVPAVSKLTYQKLNSTSRQFVGILKTIRNDAILLNGIYRLGIDFDKQTWWVESQNKFSLLKEEADPKLDKKKKKDEKAPSNFQMVAKFSSEPKEVPSGLRFDGLFTERSGFAKEGIGYVYFFPNGYNEAAILYLNRDGSTDEPYSLVMNSTTGRVVVFKKKINDFNGI